MSDSKQKRGGLEAANELRHFLKVARPEWSCRKRHGPDKVQRVLDKLYDVGICDTESLVEAVESNSINQRLSKAGHVPFGKEALDGIRRQTPFIRALDNIGSPLVRQVGNFASVPQLLTQRKIIRPDSAAQAMRRHNSSPMIGGRPLSGMSGLTSERPTSSRLYYSEAGFGDDSIDVAPLFLRGAKTTRRKRPVRTHDHSVWSDEDDCTFDSTSMSAVPMNVTQSGGFFMDQSSTGGASRILEMSDEIYGNDKPSDSRPGSPSQMLSSSLRPSSRGELRRQRTAVSFDATSDLQESDLTPTRTAPSENSRSPPQRLARSMTTESSLGGAGLHSSMAPAGEPKNTSQPTTGEVERICKLGAAMRAEKLEARWAPSFSKSLVEQGEEILHEQDVIEQRFKFMRNARSRDMGMRQFVAANIKKRMKEESGNETAAGLSMQQRAMNIKKNLTCMTNARRELASMKARISALHGFNESDAGASASRRDDL